MDFDPGEEMFAVAAFEPVLSRNFAVADSQTLKVYEARGGYQAARKALTQMTPDAVTQVVKDSELRGRGRPERCVGGAGRGRWVAAMPPKSKAASAAKAASLLGEDAPLPSIGFGG